jgi:YVTN family beta-propeller protein
MGGAGPPKEPAKRVLEGSLDRDDIGVAADEPGTDLLVFLFADIRGYTSFTQRYGDEAAAVLTARFATSARELADQFGGRLLELRGDEALCVFTSPRQSLRCAAALQRRFVDLTVADPAHPMTVGIGLDVGEAVEGPDGYRGGALNLAARLCSEAKAGEILATAELSHLARTIEGVRYLPRASVDVKGLSGPVQPVRVVSMDADPMEQLAAMLAQQRPHQPAVRRIPGPIAAHPRVFLAGIVAVVLVLITSAVVIATNRAQQRGFSLRENSLTLVDGTAARVLDQVPLHDSPGASVVGAHSIWTASKDADLVTRVDLRDHTISRIPVGSEPVALAVGHGAVWVANNGSGSVTRIDTNTDHPTEIDGVGLGPSGIAVGTGSVWVTDTGDGLVARIDPAQNAVVERIDVGDGPTGIVVDRDVWVADTNSHTLVRINGAGRKHEVVQTYTVGNGPTGVAVHGDAVWATNSLDNTISRVPVDGGPITSFPLGPEPRDISVVGDHLWITSHATDTIFEVDPGSPAAVHAWSVGALPEGLASSDTGIWVATTIGPGMHRGGTLGLVGVDPQSIDPDHPTPEAIWLLNSTFDGLVGFQHETGAVGGLIVPDLAVALPSVSSDGLTYTFQLRRGIRWSNGEPLTVADVRRGLERAVLAPETALAGVIAGGAACRPQRCDISGLSVDAVARTVKITLVNANAGFLNLLTGVAAVPPHTALAVHQTRVLPGTGPYRIVSYTPGKALELARNRYFREWSHAAQPAGFPDRIEYRITGDDPKTGAANARAVLAGKADWADVRAVPDLGARAGGLLHAIPEETMYGLSLNTTIEPFNHRRARMALAYALDRGTMARSWFGPATPTCQLLPPNSPGYRPYCPYTGARDDTGKWHEPDLSKGLRLVRGLDLSVPITVWAPEYAARAFRDIPVALRQLGYRHVRLHITSSDPSYFDFVANSRNRVQAAFFGWIGGDASPSELLSLWSCRAIVAGSSSNPNTAQFCDPHVDALMRTARTVQETSLAKASAAWHHVDAAVVDAAPWIPLVNPAYSDVVSGRVRGYERHLWLGPLFDQMRLR